jgi:hypothetical protein
LNKSLVKRRLSADIGAGWHERVWAAGRHELAGVAEERIGAAESFTSGKSKPAASCGGVC